VLWVFAASMAGVMADVYNQPQLRVLIPIAGLNVLILGFNSISLARMRRHIRLGKIVIIQISGRVLAAVVMITWAFIAPTVWAHVAGSPCGAMTKMILSHTIVDRTVFRPGWDKESVRGLLNFGKWIFISTILAFLAGQADRLIFGRLLPVATLGVYSIALMFAAIPTQLVWTIGNLVLFPTFSRSSDSTQPLHVTYRLVRRPIYMLGTLPVALLAAGGPALIAALYDARYVDAGWMLQPLAFGTWVQILQTVSAAALLSLGDSRRQALGNGMKVAAMLAFMPAGFMHYGALGGISGMAAAEVFRYATLAYGARQHQLPGPSADLAYTLFAVAAAGVGIAVDALIGSEVDPWIRLAGVAGSVLLVWAPVAAIVLREEIGQVPAMIRAQRS
jgi:O-antigen/teichoic acid export membrane protein